MYLFLNYIEWYFLYEDSAALNNAHFAGLKSFTKFSRFCYSKNVEDHFIFPLLSLSIDLVSFFFIRRRSFVSCIQT